MIENQTPLPNGALPHGSMPETTVDLDKAIEKSKAEILMSQNAPIKRGRGRPRKIQPDQAKPSIASPGLVSAAPQFDCTPYLKQAVQMPFAVVAAKLKCDEIKVTDEQAAPVASAADNFIRAYAPDLEKADPKKIAAVALAVSLGMLIFEKYSVYSVFSQKPTSEVSPQATQNAESIQTPTNETHAPAENIFGGRVPADDAYRQRATSPWSS